MSCVFEREINESNYLKREREREREKERESEKELCV